MEDVYLHSVLNLRALRELDLSNNDLCDHITIIMIIQALPNLCKINIKGNKLNDNPQSVAEISQYEGKISIIGV